jgi:3-hydroxybutyryl-CoA dehydrogenase
MGTEIAGVFALAGSSVRLVSTHPQDARVRAEATLDQARDYRITRASVSAASERIVIADDIGDQPCDLIVESLPEQFGLKVEHLAAAATRHPHAILATNTSSLSVTDIGHAIGAPERTLGTHFWNPPLLLPLVELISGAHTSDKNLDRAEAILLAADRKIVRVRDVPGFVWNRLQFALLREAMWLVEHDVISASALDQIVREGLARRWVFAGPFETTALGGLDTFGQIARNLFPVLACAKEAQNLESMIPTDVHQLHALGSQRRDGLARYLREERRIAEADGDPESGL